MKIMWILDSIRNLLDISNRKTIITGKQSFKKKGGDNFHTGLTEMCSTVNYICV